MTPSKKIKYWQYIFLIASFQGGYALFKLISIPSDSTNALFLGLSASRLLMAIALLFATILSMWLGFHSWRKPAWAEKYLSPENYPKAFSALNWLSFSVALFASITIFLLRYYDPVKYLPLYLRAAPLIFYIIILGYEFSLWLLYLRTHAKPQSREEKKNKKNFASLRLCVRKITKTPTFIIFAILLILLIFVSLTRIGLTPDTAYWSEPGIAIQSWQFALALILGFLTLLFSLKLSLKKSDLLIALLIWGIAVAIWWSVPMDVLKSSFYAPFAHPLNKSLPYSDAGFYDYLSQGLLLGEGFLAKIPPRPLYIVFLAGLRALVGINNYDQIMLGQTLIYALFPVLLYFLGKTLHSRAAGITVAFFGIFREWTNLLVSSQTRVSNSRMTLTDLPTALVLSLVALVIIFWLKKRDRAPLSALVSGGIFGMLLLLRTQTMLILPFIFLLSLLIFLPNWKNWIRISIIFIFGVALTISPWLTRNAQITGKFTFDDPNQIAVLASQYKRSDNLNWTDFNFENESLSNSIIGFALQNPAYVANFIGTHFFATEINGLNALPHIASFNSLQDPINIYWTDWDGHPSRANQILIIFYLAIIALGIGATWKKLKWIGLIPLAFNLGYALSNGVARFSGWRYDFPADWVAYFYFGIGFIELLILLSSLFDIDTKENLTQRTRSFTKQEQKKVFPSSFFVVISFSFLAIGFTPLILENFIPPHFPDLSEEELFSIIAPNNAEIKAFAEQEDVEIMMGRLIYPRFHSSGNGIYSAHPWPAYEEQDFSRMGFVLINERNTQVVFPLKHMPSTFPNGVDVILLGCQKDRYLEARLVYVMDTEESIISEKEFLSCLE